MTTLISKKRNLLLVVEQDQVWVTNRDQAMVEGEALTFSLRFLDASSVSSPDTKCYLNNTDYSSTALSGSASASGDTVICETVTAQTNDGGKIYVIEVSATVDGDTRIAKFIIRVQKPGAER